MGSPEHGRTGAAVTPAGARATGGPAGPSRTGKGAGEGTR